LDNQIDRGFFTVKFRSLVKKLRDYRDGRKAEKYNEEELEELLGQLSKLGTIAIKDGKVSYGQPS